MIRKRLIHRQNVKFLKITLKNVDIMKCLNKYVIDNNLRCKINRMIINPNDELKNILDIIKAATPTATFKA